ncbi:MAG: septation protein IspZ, partial [Nitrosomonas sp.]
SRLNLSWVGFFLTMGCVNLYVAFNFPVDTWVTFKLFGATGMMLVFVIAQVMMLGKYLQDAPAALTEDASVSEPDDFKDERENKANKER